MGSVDLLLITAHQHSGLLCVLRHHPLHLHATMRMRICMPSAPRAAYRALYAFTAPRTAHNMPCARMRRAAHLHTLHAAPTRRTAYITYAPARPPPRLRSVAVCLRTLRCARCGPSAANAASGIIASVAFAVVLGVAIVGMAGRNPGVMSFRGPKIVVDTWDRCIA
jgi:hypothetical protein